MMLKMMPKGTGKSGKKGAALIEFALVMPLLLLLVFGIIEFGVFFYDRAMLTNASREGAREGALFRATPGGVNDRLTVAEIQTIVSSYCEANLVTFGSPSALVTTVSPDPTDTLTTGSHITVQATYHYDFLVVPAFITSLTGGLELWAQTTMRAE